jgi:hypothetical protein
MNYAAPDKRPWFFADDIFSLLGLNPNEVFVPLPRLCERLGLALSVQERRLKAHPVLAGNTRRLAIEDEDGNTTRQLCLRIELVPFWLLTLDAGQVHEAARSRLETFQLECASTLWQGFRPQGFGSGDALLPDRFNQSQAETAYAGEMTVATLARQQMLIERQLDAAQYSREEQGDDPFAASAAAVDDINAARLAQTVRRVARTAGERSRRNEYPSIYSGLFRQFGISSYRRMPSGRLYEALEWLERWYGDAMGEPEPPPDI